MSGNYLVYAMTGAESICGGIATANKNALRAMLRLMVLSNRPLVVVSLLESTVAKPAYLPDNVIFRGCDGSKRRFARHIFHLGILRSLIVFDHVTLAIPVLPLTTMGWCQSVIIAHGSEADDRMRRSSVWSFKMARLVGSNSELTRKRLLKRVPAVNCQVCLLGLSPDIPLRSSPELVEETQECELVAIDGRKHKIEDQMLLLVARIDSGEMEKGHCEVIRALSELRKSYPRVQAVFPGPGGGRVKLEKLATDLGVADCVFLPGFVAKETLETLYRSCYSFVMPSKQEGFGLVYLEAMNFAKSCIGCRDDGAEEVIVHESTGLLISDQRDNSELVSVLSRLLADPEWNRELGLSGFTRLRQLFSSELHQERFQKMMQEIVRC